MAWYIWKKKLRKEKFNPEFCEIDSNITRRKIIHHVVSSRTKYTFKTVFNQTFESTIERGKKYLSISTEARTQWSYPKYLTIYRLRLVHNGPIPNIWQYIDWGLYTKISWNFQKFLGSKYGNFFKFGLQCGSFPQFQPLPLHPYHVCPCPSL